MQSPPSVRLSVRLFPLYLLNRLTVDLELLHVSIGLVMTIARRLLKVKVIGQGQGYHFSILHPCCPMETSHLDLTFALPQHSSQIYAMGVHVPSTVFLRMTSIVSIPVLRLISSLGSGLLILPLQRELNILNCCTSKGHVPKRPIARDASATQGYVVDSVL